MKDVGIVYHDIYSKHNTGNHPERADRVIETIKQLKQVEIFGDSQKNHFKTIIPNQADTEKIKWNHTSNLIHNIEAISLESKNKNKLLAADGNFGDTIVSPDTYQAALYAVGGNFSSIDAIIENKINRGFVLCRPPGHHANTTNARGFCIFNNIALAAEYLIKEKGIKKIAIVDFDAHAGNGTEDILNSRKDDGEILFFSIHQHPATLYPGTCFIEDIGINHQLGKIVNLTFLPYSGQQCVDMGLNQIILPMLEEFRPEFILISAGYDAHHSDQLTTLGFMNQTYSIIINKLTPIANTYAKGRIQCTLEGGYNLEAISRSIANTINSLADDKTLFQEEYIFPESDKVIEFTESKLIPELKNMLSAYWKCF